MALNKIYENPIVA